MYHVFTHILIKKSEKIILSLIFKVLVNIVLVISKSLASFATLVPF